MNKYTAFFIVSLLPACGAEERSPIAQQSAAARGAPNPTESPTTTPNPNIPPVFVSDNDPANCIDHGFVTYRNSIAPLMAKRCSGCHGPTIGVTNPGGFAVDPVSPQLSTWSEVEQHLSDICNAVTPPSPDQPAAMPPAQSDPLLEPEEARLFSAWCTQRARYQSHSPALSTSEQHWLLRGKQLPTIEILGVVDGRNTPLPPLEVHYQTTADPEGTATVAIFVDDDREGFDGTVVDGCLPPGQTAVGRYTWHDWQDLSPGTYYVYGCIFDHQTVACDYAEQKLSIVGT